LLDVLRAACERTGFSLRNLAGQIEVSPALLSLVLQGKRRASPELIEKLAEVLPLDPRERAALESWSRLNVRADTTALLDAARELENLHPDLVVRAPPPDELRLRREFDAPPESMYESPSPTYRASDSEPPRYDPYSSRLLSIPLIGEGELPGESHVHAAESIDLSPALLLPGDELLDPFAWRLGPYGVDRIRDMLRPGDVVVLSRQRPPFDFRHEDVWLVEADGRRILSRVTRDGDLLLLSPSPSGTGPTVLRPTPDGPPDQHVRAKVVAAIRTWGAGRRPGR
jgi:transcriptional regulator with XRE-family HTH domain